MRAIYQRAQGVLVWLGPASKDSDLAMDLLEKMGGSERQIQDFEWSNTDWFGPNFDAFQGVDPSEWAWKNALANHANSLDLIGPDGLSEEDWLALYRLLVETPWWRRLWIIQEVSNGQKVRLVCGKKSISWDTLANLEKNKLFDQSEQLQRILDRGPGVLIQQRRVTRHPFRANGFE
jgi:hypothetical protein